MIDVHKVVVHACSPECLCTRVKRLQCLGCLHLQRYAYSVFDDNAVFYVRLGSALTGSVARLGFPC